MLGGLAADERRAGDLARGRDAADDARDALRYHLAARDVVRHEQRLGAHHDDVVDDHADQVEADRVVDVQSLRDRDLGAHAVGRRREQRLGVGRDLAEVVEPGETAHSSEDLGAVRASHGVLHQLDGLVARLGVDTGCGVRETFRHE